MKSSAASEYSPVAVEDLTLELHGEVLCYPRPEKDLFERVLGEFRECGIRSVLFRGRSRIGAYGVVGKGCVSVVLEGLSDSGHYAVKILRSDANRVSVQHESEMTSRANRLGVGPRMVCARERVAVMQLISGTGFEEWLNSLRGRGSGAKLREALKKVLDQCHRLDRAGIQHGELSNLRKHLVMGDEPVIIDFESARLSRRPSNLTSAAQYLLVGGPVAWEVRRRLGIEGVDRVIGLLRGYKKSRTRRSFEVLCRGLGLP